MQITATILSLIGLTCDIFGAYLLFKHGFISEVYRVFINPSKQPEERESDPYWVNTNKLSNHAKTRNDWGFYLLIIGFSLQFAGTLLSAIVPFFQEEQRNCNRNKKYYDYGKYPPVAYINYSY